MHTKPMRSGGIIVLQLAHAPAAPEGKNAASHPIRRAQNISHLKQ